MFLNVLDDAKNDFDNDRKWIQAQKKFSASASRVFKGFSDMHSLSHALIRHFEMFHNIPDDTVNDMLAHAAVLRLAPGMMLFREATVASHFFMLMSGTLKAFRTNAQGKQSLIRFAVPGDVVGIAVVIGIHDYPTTVQAVTESLCLAWPSSEWGRMAEVNPHLTSMALHTIGQRLHSAYSRIHDLSRLDVEQRLARNILLLLGQSCRIVDGGHSAIGFPLTRQDLADLTGTTQHTVSRLLSAWQGRGIVRNARKQVVVTDMEALVRLAQSAPGADGVCQAAPFDCRM